MRKLGLNDESIVVIYDDGGLEMAARLLYLLKYIRKDNVFILEGGIHSWEKNNGEITAEIPSVNKSDNLHIRLNKNMILNKDYVKKAINKSNTAIIDARTHERTNAIISEKN